MNYLYIFADTQDDLNVVPKEVENLPGIWANIPQGRTVGDVYAFYVSDAKIDLYKRLATRCPAVAGLIPPFSDPETLKTWLSNTDRFHSTSRTIAESLTSFELYRQRELLEEVSECYSSDRIKIGENADFSYSEMWDIFKPTITPVNFFMSDTPDVKIYQVLMKEGPSIVPGPRYLPPGKPLEKQVTLPRVHQPTTFAELYYYTSQKPVVSSVSVEGLGTPTTQISLCTGIELMIDGYLNLRNYDGILIRPRGLENRPRDPVLLYELNSILDQLASYYQVFYHMFHLAAIEAKVYPIPYFDNVIVNFDTSREIPFFTSDSVSLVPQTPRLQDIIFAYYPTSPLPYKGSLGPGFLYMSFANTDDEVQIAIPQSVVKTSTRKVLPAIFEEGTYYSIMARYCNLG
ncbi:MAG: hypothetical protein QXL70_04795 [Metallosphaera sp.]